MLHRSMWKAFLILGCVIILLVYSTFGFGIVSVYKVMQKNMQSYLLSTHQQVSENIAAHLLEIENIGISVSYSPSVQRFLLCDDPVEQLHLFTDVQAVFSNLYYMDHAISCFSIYGKDGRLLAANGLSHAGITMLDAIEPDSNLRYDTEYPANAYIGKSYPAYTLTLPVLERRNDLLSGNQIGTIVLTIEVTFIEKQLLAADLSDEGAITLADQNGKVIASSKTEADPALLNEAYSSFFDTPGWTLTTSYRSGMLTKEMESIWRTTLLTAVFIGLLLLFFLWMIYRHFLRPITDVSRFMRSVSAHPSAKQYSSPPKQFDELHAMTNAMNSMIKALDQKTEELLLQEKKVYEAELAKDQLEILAYRSQINPHFLYNTLECISGMAMMHHADEIAKISQSLSNMFRYAIKGSDFVTVEEELAHMQEYATIIHYRFMGRISIHLSVSDDALKIMIPRLVLQPILENSVFHGLERKPGKGDIFVDVTTARDTLVMCVSDNGIGLQEEQLKALQQRLDQAVRLSEESTPDRHGIGLWNIARRLYLFYQEAGTLTVESSPGQGTIVKIHLPIK